MSPSRPTSAGEPRARVPGSGSGVVLPLVPGFERAPARRRPLPDAGAVRLLLVPDSAPPYDDGSAAADPGSRSPRPAPATRSPRPDPSPGSPRPAPATRSPRPAPRPQSSPSSRPDLGPQSPPSPRPAPGPQSSPSPRPAPGPPLPGGQPGAAGWPSRFAQVLTETLAGSRPQRQITPWTTDRARRLIRQLGPMLAAGTAPRVRRVVATRPAPGVVEMTVIVGCGPRVRALAVRLERDEPHRADPGGRHPKAARWVCTAIEAA